MIISIDKYKFTGSSGSGSGNTPTNPDIEIPEIEIPEIEIPEISYRPYDGNVDEVGLRAIGWSEENIQYLKDNVYWYKENDSGYVIPEDEIVLYQSEGSTSENYNTWLKNYKITPPLVLDKAGSQSVYIFNDYVISDIIPSFTVLNNEKNSIQLNCNLKLIQDVIIDGTCSTIPKFNESKFLSNIDKIIYDNTNAQYFSNMFSGCYSLKTIPELDTSKANNMSSMFSYCYSLQSIPELDTSNATYMTNMFSYCYSLQSVPALDTSKVTSASSMFKNCTSLKTIPALNTSNVTDMSSMFSGCYSLQSIPELDTSKATGMSSMFSYCTALKTIPVLNTSNATEMSYMFQNCTSLQSIPELDMSKARSFEYMFENCISLKTIPALNISNATSTVSMFKNCTSLKTIPALNTPNVTTMQSMFSGCYSLQSVPELDTSNVTAMGYMFSYCYSLQSVPELDTSKVKSMAYMFQLCTSLKTIPALNTSNVTNMDSMFTGCYSLQSIPVLDTSKVKSMSYTFENCNSLQYIEGIDFSSLTSNPTGMPAYIKRINVNGKIDFSWTYGLDKLTILDYETIKSFLVAMSKTTTTTAKTIKFNINLLDRGTELRKLVTLCASKGWTITGLTIEGIEYTPEEDENDDLLLISVIDANTNEKVGEFTQTVTSVPNVYSYPFENVTGDFYFVDAQGNYYANPVSKADNIYGKNSSTANVSSGVSYYLNKSQQVIHVDTTTRYVVHICLDDETIRWNGNTTAIPTGTPTN